MYAFGIARTGGATDHVVDGRSALKHETFTPTVVQVCLERVPVSSLCLVSLRALVTNWEEKPENVNESGILMIVWTLLAVLYSHYLTVTL